MADSSTGEKTEAPSLKRRKDAREKGQVARSQDMVAAAALLAVTGALVQTGPQGMARLGARLADGLARLDEHARGSATPNDVTLLMTGDLAVIAVVVGPFLLTAAVVGLAGHFAQAGWVFAPQRLAPDWSRLSPAQGLSRLKPSQSGLDLVKTLVTATVIGVLAYNVVAAALAESPRLAWMAPAAAAAEGWALMQRLLWQVGFALVAFAGADYGLQAWRQFQSLKMTKQEVADEARSSEGNPELKARVRRVQREMTRGRMLTAVKTATVVITNPTHFAVALEYRRSMTSAPVVVAKGQDVLAQKIKAIAREQGVPMVENVSLAQALYRGADVGEAIPGDLFGAVAEVLAYLVRIKQLTL
ncbi:MAG: EscU/YscU/HrcU family type III secretion system export apparatus switch protein [Vicinamibacterales bacterium]|jgi:flagellar biosynthetic protein FlhB